MLANVKGNVFLGTDTEFFFAEPDGKPISADAFLPGKSNPLKAVDDMEGATPETAAFGANPGATLHWDGVQGEITVVESTRRTHVLRRVRHGFQKAHKLAASRGVSINVDSSVETDHAFLQAISQEVRLFGCDPDFQAWQDGSMNETQENPDTHYRRYAGTHIHLGVGGTSAEVVTNALLDHDTKIKIVQVMDVLVGNTMVLFEQTEASFRRRDLYGRAGVFRPTGYGVEYRVPGASITRHPAIFSLAFLLSRASAEIAIAGEADSILGHIAPEHVIVAINNNDATLAKEILTSVWDLGVIQSTEDGEAIGSAAEILARSSTFVDDVVTNWSLGNNKLLLTDSLPSWEN